MFPDVKQDGKKPVPNGGTESGPGRGYSQTFKTLLFPFFAGNIRFPGNDIWELRPLVRFLVKNKRKIFCVSVQYTQFYGFLFQKLNPNIIASFPLSPLTEVSKI